MIVNFDRPARGYLGKSSARLLPNQEVRNILGNECFEQLTERFRVPYIYIIEDSAFKAAFPADKAYLANALIMHVSNQRIGHTEGTRAAVFMSHGT